jgi:hypothetical protein
MIVSLSWRPGKLVSSLVAHGSHCRQMPPRLQQSEQIAMLENKSHLIAPNQTYKCAQFTCIHERNYVFLWLRLKVN